MWKDLSFKDRSELMSLFLKQGVSSLSDMRNIYNGISDIHNSKYRDYSSYEDRYANEETLPQGSIDSSVVTASLSRDEWNNLYKNGKVKLTDIPRKYQSWIEGENSQLKQKVTQGIDEFGSKYAMPFVMGLAAGGSGGAVAGLANTAFDIGINAISKGKNSTWGEMLVNAATKGKAEEHPWWTLAAEFTNPLNFISSNTTNSIQKIFSKNKYYDVLDEVAEKFGKNSPEYKAALSTNIKIGKNPFNLKVNFNPETNTVTLSPFSRKTSIAHELGHSVGNNLEKTGQGLLFDTNYRYAGRTISDDLDSIPREQYADAFREIVHPYKGFNRELRARATSMNSYLNRDNPSFINWSKSGEEVPKYLQDEYFDIYRKLRLQGKDVLEESAKLGITPQAYIQMQSKNYKHFLDYWGGNPNVQYHGSMIDDAVEFPSPQSLNYKRNISTSTGSEGIYVTPLKDYADRYTDFIGIKKYRDYRPEWYKGGKNYIVTVGTNPISQMDKRLGKFPANFLEHLETSQKEFIESLGYNGITGKSIFGDYPENVVFYPSQIKSLEGNIGYFNPRSSNIYKAFGGRKNNNNIDNTYQVSLNEFEKAQNNAFSSNNLVVRPAPINYKELALRQRYAESTFNDKAVSPKGAIGAYGIMPATHKWYVQETGDEGDLTNSEYNEKIRNWLMEKNLKSDIHSPMDTDSVRMAKLLLQYNYGSGNTRRKIRELDALGVDTHTSLDWLNAFPTEPEDYVNFILRNKDINEHKSNKSYKKAKNNLKIK